MSKLSVLLQLLALLAMRSLAISVNQDFQYPGKQRNGVENSNSRPPFKPVINTTEDFKNLLDVVGGTHNQRNVTCCAHADDPNLNLYFQIGEPRVLPGKHRIITTKGSNNGICINWLNATFFASDNGVKLLCGADHISFSKDEFYHDSVYLNVEYDPRFRHLTNGTTTVIAVPKRTAIWNLNVTAEGNPIPILSLTLNYPNGSIVAFEESSMTWNLLFLVSISPEYNGPFEKIAKLQILNVQRLIEENIGFTFTATNIHGKAFINFRFEVDRSHLLKQLLIVMGLTLAMIITAVISIVITVRSYEASNEAVIIEESKSAKTSTVKETQGLSVELSEEVPFIATATPASNASVTVASKFLETSL